MLSSRLHAVPLLPLLSLPRFWYPFFSLLHSQSDCRAVQCRIATTTYSWHRSRLSRRHRSRLLYHSNNNNNKREEIKKTVLAYIHYMYIYIFIYTPVMKRMNVIIQITCGSMVVITARCRPSSAAEYNIIYYYYIHSIRILR